MVYKIGKYSVFIQIYYMFQYFIIDYGVALPLRGLPRYYSVG